MHAPRARTALAPRARTAPALRAKAARFAVACALSGCGGEVNATKQPAAPGEPCVESPQGPGGPRWGEGCLRVNHLQAIGSHNSYHVKPRPTIFAALSAVNEGVAKTLDFSHPPLDQQLRGGLRQLELDVFADPNGGLYANRLGPPIIGEPAASGVAELDRPGFKVFHIQDVDFESNCWSLSSCLTTIRGWSRANPRHLPIMVLVEAKYQSVDDLGFDFTDPLAIGGPELDALDLEIREALGESILSPDFVRGARPTLEEAVRADGWPTVEAARGKVIVALDNEDSVRDAYLAGHPSLAGRAMFVSARPGRPEAAFVKLNDAKADGALIKQLSADGLLVRTRADVDTQEARSGDGSRRDAALASGAHYVSTDYPVPDPAFGTGYAVALPEGPPARCNPLSAPSWCEPGLFAEP